MLTWCADIAPFKAMSALQSTRTRSRGVGVCNVCAEPCSKKPTRVQLEAAGVRQLRHTSSLRITHSERGHTHPVPRPAKQLRIRRLQRVTEGYATRDSGYSGWPNISSVPGNTDLSVIALPLLRLTRYHECMSLDKFPLSATNSS